MANTNPFPVLPQYQGDYLDAQRRMAIAQALQAQAFSGPEGTEGWNQMRVVPRMNPLAGVAKLGQALLANKAYGSAIDAQRQLGQEQWQGLQNWFGGQPQTSYQSTSQDQNGPTYPPTAAASMPQRMVSAPQPSAMNPAGLPPQTAAMAYMQGGPEEYFKNFVAPYYKPTDATLAAMQSGGALQSGPTNVAAFTKSAYIPPTDQRGGTVMNTPIPNGMGGVTYQKSYLPTLPEGTQPLFDANQNVVGAVPLSGVAGVIQSNAAAQGAGQAQSTLEKVWNPDRKQYELVPRSSALSAGGGGSTAPLANNNPGSLMPGGRLASYPDIGSGLKALDDNLASYGTQGVNTVRGIISKWAPPNDASGKPINDTNSYISDVSGRLGLNPDQPLDMSNPAVRQALSTAISIHENGPAALFGGGGKRSGPMAAEPSLGETQAAVTAKTAVPESVQKDYENMALQGPQALQAMDALDKMIELAKNKPVYLTGGLGAIPGVNRTFPDAAEYEKQRANVISLMSKSATTDAARENISESVPDYGKPTRAMLDGLQTQKNQMSTTMMRRQLLTPSYNSGDSEKYTNLSNGFDQNISPKMAPVLQLRGEAQRQAVKAAISANPELKSRFEWAYNNGLIQ